MAAGRDPFSHFCSLETGASKDVGKENCKEKRDDRATGHVQKHQYQDEDQNGHQRLSSFFVKEFQMPPVAIPIVAAITRAS